VRQSIVETGFPWRVRDHVTGIEMLLIPPGTFQMGCVQGSVQFGCLPVELPVHSVTLTEPFYLGRYEVTQGEWLAKMGSNPAYFQPPNSPSADLRRPVEQLTAPLGGPLGFFSGTGLRLPTEAEWEYAYRAGTNTAFHASDAWPNGRNDDATVGEIAWFLGNLGASGTAQFGTKAVGQKAANGFGLHDMSGNVWERCSDRFGAYTDAPQVNPTGPGVPTASVVRGGGWGTNSDGVRASYRVQESSAANSIGFRVARNPE
jgi:formylglycine-generating enzyme required for sulfatase activity